MTVYPCSSSGDAAAILALAEEYADHPNHATYESTGRPVVSTFAGSDCTFVRFTVFLVSTLVRFLSSFD